MKIIRGRAIDFIPVAHEDPKNPGAFKKVLFGKDVLPSGRIQMINWAKIPVGKSFVSHYHENMEEIFIILSGSAEVTIDQEKETLTKGDAVFVHQKQEHGMKNIGAEEVEYLVIGII